MTDPYSDLINHIDVNSATESAVHIKLAQHHYAQRQEILQVLICQTTITMLILTCVGFIALHQFKAELIQQDRDANPVELHPPAPSLPSPPDLVKSTPHRFTA